MEEEDTELRARCLKIREDGERDLVIEDIRSMANLRAITEGWSERTTRRSRRLQWINVDVPSMTEDTLDQLEDWFTLDPLISNNVEDLMRGANHIGG